MLGSCTWYARYSEPAASADCACPAQLLGSTHNSYPTCRVGGGGSLNNAVNFEIYNHRDV